MSPDYSTHHNNCQMSVIMMIVMVIMTVVMVVTVVVLVVVMVVVVIVVVIDYEDMKMTIMVATTHHDNCHARPTEPLELLLEESYGEQAHEDHDGTFYQKDK